MHSDQAELGDRVGKMLKEQFGIEGIDLNFREMGKGRLYAYTNCEFEFKLRKVSQGIYFGTIEKDGLRLSIEGSFLVGPKAKENIVELSKEEAQKWMEGDELELNGAFGRYVILKSGSYFLGCGKVKGKRIINFVPKNRRIL